MVDFTAFTAEAGLPTYTQILSFVKRGLVSGAIRNGDELPSRRNLSALLNINPNTVQKVYRILEQESLILSRPGAKSVVTAGPERIAALRTELMEQEVRRLVRAMRQMGLSCGEAGELLVKIWDEASKAENEKEVSV